MYVHIYTYMYLPIHACIYTYALYTRARTHAIFGLHQAEVERRFRKGELYRQESLSIQKSEVRNICTCVCF